MLAASLFVRAGNVCACVANISRYQCAFRASFVSHGGRIDVAESHILESSNGVAATCIRTGTGRGVYLSRSSPTSWATNASSYTRQHGLPVVYHEVNMTLRTAALQHSSLFEFLRLTPLGAGVQRSTATSWPQVSHGECILQVSTPREKDGQLSLKGIKLLCFCRASSNAYMRCFWKTT